MITIHLYGRYAKKHGSEFRLMVKTIPAALRLLAANFGKAFSDKINLDAFYVCKGALLGVHQNLEERHIGLEWPEDTHIHIIPKATGAASMKKKGLGSILLGVVLLGASFLFPGFLGMSGVFAGLSLIAGGASLLLTPEVGVKDEDAAKSYSFNGPMNSDEQGAVQPIVYGRARAGSVIMGGSIKSVNSKKTD